MAPRREQLLFALLLVGSAQALRLPASVSKLLIEAKGAFLGAQGAVLATTESAHAAASVVKDIARRVNAMPGATWKAREDWDGLDSFKPMLGAARMSETMKRLRMKAPASPAAASLPLHFDVREQWPYCRDKMNEILDQGHCGSCWAFGAVNAITDRNCIKNHVNATLSQNDVLACCDFCGDGCNGGLPMTAYDYWCGQGLVSNVCDPYFDAVGCKHPGCVPVYDTPKCVRQCAADDSGEVWAQAKFYGKQAFAIPQNQYEIMHELMRDGPVTASFTVFADFTTYQSGIYQHYTGEAHGIHAVKLMGWGSENGVDFWLVANSWRPDWGMGGFFKIRRGVNECGIEDSVIGGIPAGMEEIARRRQGAPPTSAAAAGGGEMPRLVWR